jgi:hypothetical protein
MFEKFGQAAEKVAINVSRRAFLGRLGQGALATAGVLAGMLAISGKALARNCPRGAKVCGRLCCPAGSYCCYVANLANSERCCYRNCLTGNGQFCF